NFILNNFNIGIYAKNGSVLFDNDTKKVSINNAKTGIKALNKAKISFNNGNFELTNVSTGVYATQQSEIKLSNVNTTLTNVDCFVYSTDNSDISLQGKVVSRQNANQYFINAVGGSKVLAKFKNADIKTGTFVYSGSDASVNINSSSILADSINFAYAQDNSLINININNFIATGTEFFAGASENSNIILTATDSAKISGLLIADAINAFSDQNQKASVELNLGVSESNSFVRNSNNFIFNGDAITANKGTINLNLGQGSYWEGRSDDFKDADSEEWRQEHGQEFGDVVSDLQSSGRVNVTMSDGAYWNVTGQSWVSKLDGNGTIDLRGSETGGYAIHIGEITGSNTFLVNLDKDNKSQSDMIYVYNGSGAAEQNIVISNRDEVLDSMDVGERVRFATVANASGGFISDGMTTEFSGKKSISTFGKNTQIRDAGVKNVNFKIVYEPYNTDKATAEEDLGYNGGESFNDTKPGNEYVESIYSEGENPYNVYIERLVQSEGNDDISDIGKTVVDLSRANYANAVYMDTLNKRQGEARFVGNTDHGVWVRLRHDNIGKEDAFRSHNTMVEVGIDQRDVHDYGEFHTGVALDLDYHTVDGDGDIERYGIW
ncbi:hypothetical protein, partial [uncultured Succinatimonas sp.]|uniref:hypothetical protein n=1 Tax=uncultured Succinatimonas sp. TaxID=1262973 RepID=UPI0027D9AFC1